MWHIKALTIFLSFTTFACAEVEEGKVLFNEASCLDCHNHEDFGDEKSKLKMFKGIEARVQACQLSESDELFDDEVHDIAKYLNKEFYKFKK